MSKPSHQTNIDEPDLSVNNEANVAVADLYDDYLIDVLVDSDKWPFLQLDDDFIGLSNNIKADIDEDSVAGKIAMIFAKHQLAHEMIKSLIRMSNLYVQGEIWPTVYNPKLPEKEEKISTDRLLNYYDQCCVQVRGKEDFYFEIKEINQIRNKIAHHLVGKNSGVINRQYITFNNHFKKVLDSYKTCEDNLAMLLIDLTSRVDFNDLRQ